MFPEITELIPHRGPSVLVDGVVDYRPESVVCAAEIRPGHLYEASGSVPAAVALEMMAQAAAVQLGLATRGDGSSDARPGYLIAVREFAVHRTVLPIGAPLRIAATLKRNDQSSAVFDCWVDCDGRRIAQAALTVYRP